MNYPATCHLHYWFFFRPSGNDLAGVVVGARQKMGGELEKYRLYQYETKKSYDLALDEMRKKVTDWDTRPGPLPFYFHNQQNLRTL